MTRASVLALLALLSVGAAARQTGKVTPVEKVIQLLESLEKKVTEEGAAEAAAYDKYACFCKEQADEKTYAMEQSEKRMGELSAVISLLTTELEQLETDIGALSTKIGSEESGITGAISEAETTREAERVAYKTKEEFASSTIGMIKGAIESLKDSKGSLEGHTDQEDALVQVRSVAALAMATESARRSSLTEAQWKMVAVLAQPKSGEAYQYEYHSNDIIAVLEGLLTTFQGVKDGLDQDEFDTNSAFEKKRLGLQNEKKFAEKEKAEREMLMEQKTEEKEATVDELSKETTDRQSDSDFRDVLTEECQFKAQAWDQRSTARAGELTALSQAMATLKEGVVPNYGANKKLNGLVQKNVTVVKAALEVSVQGNTSAPHLKVESKTAGEAAPSFLQLRGSGNRPSNVDQATRIHAFLLQASRNLKSPTLGALALKVQSAGPDHFVKVRGIIKDLIGRLKADATAEKTQKSFCDEEMGKAVAKRDEESQNVEAKNALIASLTAKIQTLTEEIALLSQQIAENKRALNEATTLRDIEKADNARTIEDAGAGKEAVSAAMATLKAFYGDGAFIQYTPPKSDRSGSTVGDLAPETFSNDDYAGAQDSSKGIIGMLEVILSDFDRTVTTVGAEETASDEKYDGYKTDNEADTDEKEGSKDSKARLITQAEEDLTGAKDALDGHSKAHEGALGELTKLNAMCVAGEETYEERVEKRKKEIEALKEAHGILENWRS